MPPDSVHSLVGHLDSLQFMTILNKAALNIFAQLSLCIDYLISLE